MGCGVSTFNLVDEGMACGLRPLRRRIDEVRRNDRATADLGTASTKLLLEEGDAVINDSDHGGRKSVSDAAVILKEPTLQKIQSKENMVEVPNFDSSTKKLGEEKLERGMEAEKLELTNKNEFDETIGLGKGDEFHEAAEDGDDDEGRRLSNYDGSAWIGSPSFREYCYHSESEDSIKDAGKFDGEKRENKIQAVDDVVSCTNEMCVPQGSRSRTVEKGSRGGRFRKVFPKHRPKNFWNMASCNSHNKVHGSAGKIPEKAV